MSMKLQTNIKLNNFQFAILILIGFIATFFSLIVTLCWVACIIYSFIGFYKSRQSILIWYAIAASTSLEVWSRMVSAPFIPWEIGKYFFLFLILLYALNPGNTYKPLYKTGIYILICIYIRISIHVTKHLRNIAWES